MEKKTTEHPYAEIGQIISALIDEKCQRKSDFFDAIDRPKTTVDSWLSGKYLPKLPDFYMICGRLGIPTDYLLAKLNDNYIDFGEPKDNKSSRYMKNKPYISIEDVENIFPLMGVKMYNDIAYRGICNNSPDYMFVLFSNFIRTHMDKPEMRWVIRLLKKRHSPLVYDIEIDEEDEVEIKKEQIAYENKLSVYEKHAEFISNSYNDISIKKSDGITKYGCLHWDGCIYKIPRYKLKNIDKAEFENKAFVYFLIRRKTESSDSSVYVGESECLLSTVSQYRKKKWDYCLAVTDDAKLFDKSLAMGLKWYYYDRLNETNIQIMYNVEVENKKKPHEPVLDSLHKYFKGTYIQNIARILQYVYIYKND